MMDNLVYGDEVSIMKHKVRKSKVNFKIKDVDKNKKPVFRYNQSYMIF